jgi:ATP-dependent RNA/DNA helicase IGHMBP2
MIGDSATLSQSDFYAGLIQYAEKENGYKSAWEFMG